MSKQHSIHPRVAVITPTVGSSHLLQCVRSVAEQLYTNVIHLVVVDGPDHKPTVGSILEKAGEIAKSVSMVVLPENTGAGLFNGYRICSGFSYLVNADIIMFLDDDNWIDPDHIAECVGALSKGGAEWGFSLRKIVSAGGSMLIDDDCDSVGPWRRAASYGGMKELSEELMRYFAVNPFLIDTSCYFFKQRFLWRHAHLWMARDSYLASTLLKHFHCICTGKRTVNYRVRKDQEENAIRYFTTGNAAMVTKYGAALPWKTSQLCSPLERENYLEAFPQGEIRTPARTVDQLSVCCNT